MGAALKKRMRDILLKCKETHMEGSVENGSGAEEENERHIAEM